MATTLTMHPPRTIREVFDALPEGTLAQLIENKLIMTPAPSYIHQRTLNKINFLILSYLESRPLGEVIIAPYDVHLDAKNVFQPDIIFIKKEHLSNIQKDGYHGAPDLVIEILSAGTARYDQEEKKVVYERYGVSEYWIVDPETKEVQGFFLKEGEYGNPVLSIGLIRSEILEQSFEF